MMVMDVDILAARKELFYSTHLQRLVAECMLAYLAAILLSHNDRCAKEEHKEVSLYVRMPYLGTGPLLI